MLTVKEGSATVQRLIPSRETMVALSYARALTGRPYVPTELDIEGGYQGMLDGTSTRPPRRHSSTPRVAATVEAISNPA